MSVPVVAIKNLYVNYKIYAGILKVVNGVDFSVLPGEKVGLIGEAGCGKTTTMKAIMGILPKNSIVPNGEVFIKGKALSKMSSKEKQAFRRKSISMIFEDPTASLNPIVKIGEQLKDAIKYTLIERDGTKPTKEDIEKDAILSLGDGALPDPERIMKSYPLELSGGMRQRVVIAMSSRRASDLIIADEAATSLDVTIGAQILDVLNNLTAQKGVSLIMISHRLGAVRGMVDRVDVMYAGDIVERSEVKSFFSNPLHPYSAGLLDAVPRLTGEGVTLGIPGEVPNYINPPQGCRFHPRCKQAMEICRKSKPPFFDVKGHEVACFLYGREKT